VLGIAARLPDEIEQALNATADRFADGAPYRRVGAYTTSYRGAGLVDAYAAAVRLGAGRGVDKPARGADRLREESVDAMKGGRSS
jgi:hypothetical protein